MKVQPPADNGVYYGSRAVDEDLVQALMDAGPPFGNQTIHDVERGVYLRHWGRNQGRYAGRISIMHRGEVNDNCVAFTVNPFRAHGKRLPWKDIHAALERLDWE